MVAKVELTHPPRRYAKNIWVSSAKYANTELRQTPVHVRRHGTAHGEALRIDRTIQKK